MLKAILFDIDGTLVDSNEYHVLAWAEALHGAGHDFRLQTLHDQVGQGGDNFVRALLPDATERDVEELSQAQSALFQRHYAHRLQPFAGAKALLERCRAAGLKVMLATSANRETLDQHLEVLDARRVVDGWTGAADVGHSKPCPDIFEAALAKAGVEPQEALVVGDTPFDIAAAKKAGIRTVAVRSGLFPDAALGGAIAIYDNVAAILEGFDQSPLNPASGAAGRH